MTAHHKRLFAVTGLAVIGLGFVALQYWQRERPVLDFQGWVEAELVFVSAEEAGRLESLPVREGDTVNVGSPLFAKGRPGDRPCMGRRLKPRCSCKRC